MTSGPLTKRRAALDEDEDEPRAWPPSERARFIDRARRVGASRDHRLVEQGRRILAEYSSDDDEHVGDALRRYMRELFR